MIGAVIGAGATTQQAAAVKERWGIIQMNKQSRAEIRAFDAIFRTMIKLILKQPAPADAIGKLRGCLDEPGRQRS